MEFQSTHPVRGGTNNPSKCDKIKTFQSTHPVRGGTLAEMEGFEPTIISIHPPREGWDVFSWDFAMFNFEISIHPPREGWDQEGTNEQVADLISIHPPREGWDQEGTNEQVADLISIHPPREGWDKSPKCCAR